MDQSSNRIKNAAALIFVELIIALGAKLINAVSVVQAIVVFVVLVAITGVFYLVPEIGRRLRRILRVLIGKQADPQLAMLGVTSGVDSSRGSLFSPESCMSRTDRKLDFMGILGSKWIETHDNYNRFRSLLRDVEQDGNRIRFLLVDWRREGYEKLLNRRNRERQSLVERADHYRDYLELVDEFDCFEVRLYSCIPTFRLVFIDDAEFGVSRYRYTLPSQEEFDRGRKIPHVAVDKEAKFSIYEPFKWTFEEIWDDADKIGREHLPIPENEQPS